MEPLESLTALARLAAGESEPAGALCQAADIVAQLIGASDVRLASGDGVHFECYPVDDGTFFGLTTAGRVTLHAELMRLGRAAVLTVGEDGMAHGIAPADGRSGGAILAMALCAGDTCSEDLLAQGPWTAPAVQRAAPLVEAAAPALALIFDRVVDAQRRERVQQQMESLSDVARVFTRTKKMPEVLQDIVRTITSATGLLSTLDVLDSRGRIVLRSAGAARYEGTPLHSLWLRMSKGADPVRELILKQRGHVLLPDLQNDPRISEAARQFYRAASIVSGASFPLVFQDEIVGLLRVGSMKPTPFPAPLVHLLQDLAAQAAVVVKGVQMWDELQRSRKQAERYAAKLQASMEIQHRLARTDPLCGIPNRRYLEEVVAAECARAARYGSRLSLAMADLDHFKLVNDTYGHDVGDDVLRQVALRARSTCRKVDIVGRMGGDEFLFVLPATGLRRAMVWADRFRRVLEQAPLPAGNQIQLQLTASVGIAEADLECMGNPSLLVHRCDEALYSAKLAGRNQVRAYKAPLARAG